MPHVREAAADSGDSSSEAWKKLLPQLEHFAKDPESLAAADEDITGPRATRSS